MKLEIKNMLNHKSISTEIDPGCTLVTGKNSAGKTSLAAVIAGLVARDSDPKRIGKLARKNYQLKGARSGSASLGGVTWSTENGLSPEATMPVTCAHAVGIVDFNQGLNPKQRAEIWESLFLPKNPQDLIEKVWVGDTDSLDEIVAVVQTKGWDSAEAIFVQERRQHKAEWKRLTGENYGKEKAADWGSSSRLTLDQAKQNVDDAQSVIDGAKIAQSIDKSKVVEAIRIRDKVIPKIEKSIIALQSKIDGKDIEIDFLHDAENDYCAKRDAAGTKCAALTKVLAEKPDHKCPECSALLDLLNGELISHQAPSITDAKQYNDEIAGLKLEIEKFSGWASDQNKLVTEAGKEIGKIKDQLAQSRAELSESERQASHADDESIAGISEDDMAALNMNLKKANDELGEIELQTLACDAAREVERSEELCSIFGSGGVRAENMNSARASINSVVHKMTAEAGWAEIELLDDYSVTIDGIPSVLAAENERIKAQACLQIACCLMHFYSEWIIIDRADTLKDQCWDGLVAICNRVAEKNPDYRIIVCATSQATPEKWHTIKLDQRGEGGNSYKHAAF